MFRSEFPDVAIVDLPIHDAVLGEAERYGDRPALVDGVTGETVSHARLGAAVRRVAAGLAEAGVRKGDVVALFSPNTIGYPMAFYGATRAGATVTTVSSLATPGELAASSPTAAPGGWSPSRRSSPPPARPPASSPPRAARRSS